MNAKGTHAISTVPTFLLKGIKLFSVIKLSFPWKTLKLLFEISNDESISLYSCKHP